MGRQSEPIVSTPTRPITGEDHTAGNRFDSFAGDFATVYAGTTLEGCYAEVLARHRPKPSLADLVHEEWDERGWTRVGNLPAAWRQQRVAVRLTVAARQPFLDVEHADTLAHLGRELAPALAYLEVDELDVSVIRGPNRHVTRMISQWAYRQADEHGMASYAGIRYLSRVDSEQELWAIFDDVPVNIVERKPILLQDPELQEVAKRYGLILH